MRLNHRIFSFFAAVAVALCCSVGAAAQADDDPINKDEDYQKAVKAYQSGIFDTAFVYFEKAVVRFPKSARGYNWLGYTQFKRNEFESSASYLDKALDLVKRDKSEQESILACRARALWRIGKLSDAKANADQLISLNPNDVDHYTLRADVCLRLGFVMQAIDDYQKAIDLNPSVGSFYASKAMGLLKLGMVNEALTLLDNGKSLVTSSDELLAARAEVNVELKKYSEAMSDAVSGYESGFSSFPVITYLADAAPSNYKWALRSKLRTDAKNPVWQNLSGDISAFYGRYAEASESYAKAAQLSSGWPVYSSLELYAEAQKNMLNFRRAKAAYQMLCDMDTVNTYGLAGVIEVKAQLGEDVSSDMKLLASKKYIDEDLMFLCVRYDDAEMMRKSLDASETCIHKASSTYDLLRIYSERARIHLKLGDVAAAEDDARKCLLCYKSISCNYVSDSRIQGRSRFAHRTALAVLKSGGDEVDKLIASDLANKTDHADAFYNAACVRARQGRTDESIALLDSAFHYGFFNVSYLKGDPLLASVSNDPRVAKLIEARNKRVEQVAEAEPKKVVTEIPCTFESRFAKVPGSANGLKLDVIVNTDISYPTISQVEADFMSKNGYLTKSDYSDGAKSVTIKELHIGDVVLTNVKASVKEQDAAFEIDKYTLLRIGALSVDKASKKITLTGVAD